MKALKNFATSPLGWWMSVAIAAAGGWLLGMVFCALAVWGINPCGSFLWPH